MSYLFDNINQLRQVIAFTVVHDLTQGVAMDQFHREVVVPAVVAAELVDRDDVGMLELSCDSGLPQEPREHIRGALARRVLGAVGRPARQQLLDGHFAAQVDAHPELERMAEALVDLQGHLTGHQQQVHAALRALRGLEQRQGRVGVASSQDLVPGLLQRVPQLSLRTEMGVAHRGGEPDAQHRDLVHPLEHTRVGRSRGIVEGPVEAVGHDAEHLEALGARVVDGEVGGVEGPDVRGRDHEQRQLALRREVGEVVAVVVAAAAARERITFNDDDDDNGGRRRRIPVAAHIHYVG